jgi:hypothetical protein
MIKNFKEMVEKEMAKIRKIELDEVFLFIPNSKKGTFTRFDGAEEVLQELHDAGHSVKVVPSKTENAVGNYVYISLDPVEKVTDE